MASTATEMAGTQMAIAVALIISYVIYAAMYMLQLFHPVLTVNLRTCLSYV